MQYNPRPDILTLHASPSRQTLPNRREYLLSLLACAAGSSALAQEEEEVTFSTGIKLVNVLVTARDKHGRYVQDLTREDFEIQEDGNTQEITYFTRETEAPLSLGMLVDTSGSQSDVLEQERIAAVNFLAEVLRPDRDTACVLSFDGRVLKIQDMTSSLPKLENALEILDLRNPRFRNAGRNPLSKQGRSYAGTRLFDVVFLASEEILLHRDGRKAVILLSDGVDAGSAVNRKQAIAAAQKADTAVFSIRIFDPDVGGGREGPDVLRRLAKETGGSYYDVNHGQPLEEVFRDIEEALRSQYSIGYVSDRDPKPGKFHKLKVRTKRKGIKLQARTGYYAAP